MPQTMNEVLHPHAEWSRNPAFPHAPEFWNLHAGRVAAARENLHLTEDHWAVVQALQSYFALHPNINVRELHDALDERFHASGGLRYLYTLFPGGPVAQGCRIAGLTPPPGSSDRSFGAVQ